MPQQPGEITLLIISADKSFLQNTDKGQILHVPPHISYLLLPGGGGERRREAGSAWLGVASRVAALRRGERRRR